MANTNNLIDWAEENATKDYQVVARGSYSGIAAVDSFATLEEAEEFEDENGHNYEGRNLYVIHPDGSYS